MTALGAYLFSNFLQLPMLVTMLGCFGIIFALQATANTPANQGKRWALLLSFGLLEGFALGPLIAAVLDIDPSIVVTAAVASVTIFACFSMFALYSERRSLLYLGGFLSSALSMLVMMGFANMFFRSEAVYNLQLYGGLLLFIGYVCFDTQLIIEKANSGTYDVHMDALNLFLDLIAIFVRILIILAKSKKNNNKKNSNRR